MASQAETDFAGVYDIDSDFFAVTVTYIRENMELSVAAVATMLNEKQDEAHGFTQKHTEREYEIRRSLLTYQGKAVIPRAGDRIREVIGEDTYEFEVLPVDKKTASEWADPDGDMVIVRTKKVSVTRA